MTIFKRVYLRLPLPFKVLFNINEIFKNTASKEKLSFKTVNVLYFEGLA